MKYIDISKKLRKALLGLVVCSCLFLGACSKEEAKAPLTTPVPTESLLENNDIKPPQIEIESEVLGTVIATPKPDISVAPEKIPEIVVFTPNLEEKESKEDDFFANSAFLGNSIMDGFRMFSGLTTCDYYVATSMTVNNAMNKKTITLDNGLSGTLVDGVCQKQYDKVYILLGINEIYLDVNDFIAQYGEMIDKINEAQEDCDIYIMSITPVSKKKSDSDKNFNKPNITKFNDALYALAEDKECYYMDLVEALGDEEGYLSAEETSDGVHFALDTYKTWLSYVRTHYV